MFSNKANQNDGNENTKLIPLIALKNGEKGEIVNVFGGRHMNQRLSDLGLTIGTVIAIEREAPFGGPIQIMVRGSSLAIGRGIASRIIVHRFSYVEKD